MKTRRDAIKSTLLTLAAILLAAAVLAGQEHGGMQGMRCMCGMQGMHGMNADHRQDMAVIHDLFADREKIERKVTKLADGVETVTESKDPDVAARVAEHAFAMKERLEKNQPIHMWDPLFAEIFANASKIRMEIRRTPHGVTVKETSDDAAVVKLIQVHADAVSEFLEKGMSAAHERHEVP